MKNVPEDHMTFYIGYINVRPFYMFGANGKKLFSIGFGVKFKRETKKYKSTIFEKIKFPSLRPHGPGKAMTFYPSYKNVGTI